MQLRATRERTAMMSLYYVEQRNLKEIGLIMGVSESRVSQIHGQAIARLKSRLKDWTYGEASWFLGYSNLSIGCLIIISTRRFRARPSGVELIA